MILATSTQYEALDALARCGTMKSAAYSLGITRAAFEHRVKKLRKRTGLTTGQLLYRLGQGRVLVQDCFWYEAA